MKNMQNIPDKDLDNLFERAAEGYQPKYKPEAWRKMSRKLDRAAFLGFWSFRNKYLILSLGLLTGLITLILLNNEPGSSAQKSASIAPAQSEGNLENGSPGNYFKKMKEKVEGAIKEAEKKKNPSENDTGRSGNLNKIEDPGQVSESINNSSGGYQSIEGGVTSDKSGKLQIAGSGSQLSMVEKLVPFEQGFPPQLANIHPVEVIEPVSPAGERPLFSIGGAFSPDLSGINLGEYSGTGNNLALLLEWHISKRFTMATGLIRSHKVYAVKDGFLPYPGIWKRIPKPDLVDGSCIVYDIPLNLRYNFLLGERSKFYLIGGVSSYFMHQEEYNYLYDDETIYDRDYEVYNRNRHLFAITNISLGYEYLLSKRWSVQVEPFIKLPTTEIGLGNLDLHSAGAFFTLKYHLINKLTLK